MGIKKIIVFELLEMWHVSFAAYMILRPVRGKGL
jgi:hypothetical protein